MAMSTGPDVLLLPAVKAESGGNPRSSVEQQVVALFDELRACLLRYLLSFSLSVLDSEDLLQETFLALFDHLRRDKPQHNLRAWLFRVAHNLALRHQRSQRNAKVVSDVSLLTERALVCPRPNPEDQYHAAQVSERVLGVVAALPEQTRCCLHLRAEGLRYREIAEVLDISLGSVAARLEEALGRIARATREVKR
ncbi:MAG TPA: sigma-70 family RNA polymerase sigma factor [Bryobacteraceae bacterium]|jgi:RNA polymerase sigma-70 factor (ECF subfamily)|nr:sigma-70 family RNA polymerase sigma factor [Bryobacteraceae bacterium]